MTGSWSTGSARAAAPRTGRRRRRRRSPGRARPSFPAPLPSSPATRSRSARSDSFCSWREALGLLADEAPGAVEDRAHLGAPRRRRGELARVEVEEEGEHLRVADAGFGQPAQAITGDVVGLHECDTTPAAHWVRRGEEPIPRPIVRRCPDVQTDHVRRGRRSRRCSGLLPGQQLRQPAPQDRRRQGWPVHARGRGDGQGAAQSAGAQAKAVAAKAQHAATGGDSAPSDDNTLKSKVESEIFRDADAPKGSVDVSVANGIVELRGQVRTRRRARRSS